MEGNGKKKVLSKFIFLILILIILTTPALAWNPFTWFISLFKSSNVIDTTNDYGVTIDTNYECRNEVYYTYETKWETCQTVCSILNKSCDKTYSYPCKPTEIKTPHEKQVCVRKSYSINMNGKKKRFEFPKGYVCDFTENKDGVYIICDSVLDGNGDGKCASGESCVKYDLTNKVTEKTDLNRYLKRRTAVKIENE